MFGRRADLEELTAVADFVSARPALADVALCPPFTLLEAAIALAGGLKIGAQDCRAGGDGAFTGDINAAMLKDLGCTYVIVGHSERRQGHGETDAQIRAKADSALAAGLIPIVCVGETLDQREAGEAANVVRAQIAQSAPADDCVLAYEPVWAIGTGLTPTPDQIAEIHAIAKAQRAAPTAVLYGGSVKPANAAEIFAVAGVDGALVGGASLKAADFIAILRAHPAFH